MFLFLKDFKHKKVFIQNSYALKYLILFSLQDKEQNKIKNEFVKKIYIKNTCLTKLKKITKQNIIS